MTTEHINYCGQHDLKRQLSKFREQHPAAVLDEMAIQKAQTLALRLDNERKLDGAFAVLDLNHP